VYGVIFVKPFDGGTFLKSADYSNEYINERINEYLQNKNEVDAMIICNTEKMFYHHLENINAKISIEDIVAMDSHEQIDYIVSYLNEWETGIKIFIRNLDDDIKMDLMRKILDGGDIRGSDLMSNCIAEYFSYNNIENFIERTLDASHIKRVALDIYKEVEELQYHELNKS